MVLAPHSVVRVRVGAAAVVTKVGNLAVVREGVLVMSGGVGMGVITIMVEVVVMLVVVVAGVGVGVVLVVGAVLGEVVEGVVVAMGGLMVVVVEVTEVVVVGVAGAMEAVQIMMMTHLVMMMTEAREVAVHVRLGVAVEVVVHLPQLHLARDLGLQREWAG